MPAIHELLYRDTWHGGQLLAFSAVDGPTDYEHGLTARTSFGMPGMDIKLPALATLRFPLPTHARFAIAGDFFDLEASGARVRGAFLDAHHLLIEGPCEFTTGSGGVACRSRDQRTLVGSALRFDAKKLDTDLDAAMAGRSAWINRQALPHGLTPAAQRTLAKVLTTLKTQVYSPEGRIFHRWTTPDRWPHRKMWLWDSVFHAIGWRHFDLALARDMISAVFDLQRKDGFVAHMMTPHEASDVTQPPVLALGVHLVNEVVLDETWLRDLYPKLKAYLRWDMARRDTDGGGLLEWTIHGDPFCRSGESGMDNSPRFDAATRLDAVDFNAFLALECEIMAGFASKLRLDADIAMWESEHRRICDLIRRRLWSERHGFFLDYDVERQRPSEVIASSGFLPLICGAATREQAERLAAHLADPGMFGTAFPVPSISVKDPGHYTKDMWRGPVWINLNWLIARGFERYGFTGVAAQLRAQTRKGIEEACEQFGSLFEYYDDRLEVAPPALLRKGRCAPEASPYHQVIYDYGWTASLYADLVHSTHTGR